MAKEWEQECHNLQRKVTFLEDEVTTKDEKLNDSLLVTFARF